MNPKIFTRISAIPIILTMFLLILASASLTITLTSAEVTELNVPLELVQGETLSISGKAAPNEVVWIGSSFEIALPVSEEKKYRREFFGIELPKGKKTFSVTAENIKNIRVSLYPVLVGWTVEFPLEGPLNATNGTATISISFPYEISPGWEIDIHGKKEVKVYGDAADDATYVNLKIAMAIRVTADSNGDFSLDISTEGVPAGEFLISAGGIEKTVYIVSTEPITVTGTLKGFNQEPIGNAKVIINGNYTTADAAGDYSFTVLPGRYDITVNATGYRNETKTDVWLIADIRVDFAGDEGLLNECPTTTYVLQVINKWAADEISNTTKVLIQITIWSESDE